MLKYPLKHEIFIHLAGNYKIDTAYPNICISLLLCKIAKQQNNVLLA